MDHVGVRAVEPSPARERLLDVAERLFQERGLARVTMREIADAAGVRQASLYHHAPRGKAQLYREVFERMIARHRFGLETALRVAGPRLRPRLRAVADWYVGQAPMNFLRMMTSDMPALGDDEAAALAGPAYAALMRPITEALRDAERTGEARGVDADLVAGSLLAILDAVAFAERRAYGAHDQRAMAYTMIDVLLDGLTPAEARVSRRR
jgi:TetR/AcrR family transcriptional regulator, cholesterol catabolism regulator